MSGGSETLPVQVREVTAFDIIMGAAATRDWQPQHHDADHARAMNLPGVIMNTPTQTGWFHAYAMAWAGEVATVRRWKLKMLRPICPGTRIALHGTVVKRQLAEGAGEWVWLQLSMSDDQGPCSTMRLLLQTSDASGPHQQPLLSGAAAPPLA